MRKMITWEWEKRDVIVTGPGISTGASNLAIKVNGREVASAQLDRGDDAPWAVWPGGAFTESGTYGTLADVMPRLRAIIHEAILEELAGVDA